MRFARHAREFPVEIPAQPADQRCLHLLKCLRLAGVFYVLLHQVFSVQVKLMRKLLNNKGYLFQESIAQRGPSLSKYGKSEFSSKRRLIPPQRIHIESRFHPNSIAYFKLLLVQKRGSTKKHVVANELYSGPRGRLLGAPAHRYCLKRRKYLP